MHLSSDDGEADKQVIMAMLRRAQALCGHNDANSDSALPYRYASTYMNGGAL